MFLYSVFFFFLKIYLFLQLRNIPNLAPGVFWFFCIWITGLAVNILVGKRFTLNFQSYYTEFLQNLRLDLKYNSMSIYRTQKLESSKNKMFI